MTDLADKVSIEGVYAIRGSGTLSPPPWASLKIRATPIEVGGDPPGTARFSSRSESADFTLSVPSEAMARQLGALLYREVEIDARVVRDPEGVIERGELRSFEKLQSGDALDAWQVWFHETWFPKAGIKDVDPAFVPTITSVGAYLAQHGWTLKHSNDFWAYYSKNAALLLVPKQSTSPYYPRLLKSLVDAIAYVESREVSRVLRDISVTKDVGSKPRPGAIVSEHSEPAPSHDCTKPIRTQEEQDIALAEMERLWNDPKESDRAEVLLVLIEDYRRGLEIGAEAAERQIAAANLRKRFERAQASVPRDIEPLLARLAKAEGWNRSPGEPSATQDWQFLVVLVIDENGSYTATCPTLPAAISQGKTRKEALTNIRETIWLCLQTGDLPLEITSVTVVTWTGSAT